MSFHRRGLGRTVAAAALACGLSLGLTSLADQARAETLRITLQLPMKHHLGQNMRVFKDLVEEKSGGDLTVEIYDSAQLYKDKEVPQAVSSGAIEMGVASLTRFAGTIPAVDLFYVPFTFPTYDSLFKATAKDGPVRGPIDAAILETGARVLWWQAYGSAVMLSKDTPLRTPADMQDLKVRVFGKTLGDFVEAVGGVPTLISGSEQYMAYQRGTVDAGLTGITAVTGRKLWEVMDTVTVANVAAIEFVVLINEDVWQGLSDEHRAIITESAAAAETWINERIQVIEAEAIKETREHANVVELTDADLAAWDGAVEPVRDSYLAATGDLGRQLLDAARDLRP
ncbi:TRAP transporter substrate-binding protein DctP [Roseospira visakhapatnamensis]|uniref:C4-dicarboxylate-binding protein DctP n=1 Tax=Roseospira visakhapatnamensis TaxID=390880 RepID=A0A7W6RFK2_9PROT|nr:TRAP transporter substrate-binding protein DctP [Roseospira visakhapatnamensis]MBB4267656.1 C4-dicarboxylate-binding protein DctP [Roseospira visakhapatnamensis]